MIPTQFIAVLYTKEKPTFSDTDCVRYILVDCNRENPTDDLLGAILSGLLVLDEDVPLDIIRTLNCRVRPMEWFREQKSVTVTIPDSVTVTISD